MKKYTTYLIALLTFLFAYSAYADTVVPMYLVAVKGEGKAIGTLSIKETQYGLLITPNLTDLPPGVHGFHVHQNPSCDNLGMAAGEHYDPMVTNQHLGPYDQGHQGDLAILVVDNNGKATIPLLAPRIKLSDLKGHALMIHQFGDNYSDHPKLGGGGPRIACGVVK